MTNHENTMSSLAGLPGGIDDYLNSLIDILGWIDRAEYPRVDKFTEWVMEKYTTGRASVNVYLRVLARLQVVHKQKRGGKLTLTAFGKQILQTDSDTQARLLIEYLIKRYVAAREVLSLYAQSSEPLHLNTVIEVLQAHFKTWTSPTQFDERIRWLSSLKCLRRVNGRHYEVTPLGREIAERFPPDIVIQFPPGSQITADDHPRDLIPPGEEPTQEKVTRSDELVSLSQALTEASMKSTGKVFEEAVARAFEFLGFSVVRLGDSGETDVLIQATIGRDSYRVIVDAKARQAGRLEDLEAYTIQDHLRRHEADYAVVIAANFAGGKVARHAEEQGIVLLSVNVLIKWMVQHSKTPLNLDVYRVMFTTPGIIGDLPPALTLAAQKREKWAHLIIDLLELIQEMYQNGLNIALPVDQLFAMLATRLRGVRHTKQEVQDAVNFLIHPAIACATGESESGIALSMTRHTLAETLRALARMIDDQDGSSPAG